MVKKLKTNIAEKILLKLYTKRRYMSTNEIANCCKISWKTTHKYLLYLESRSFVKRIIILNNRIKWAYNYIDKIKILGKHINL